MSLLIYIIKTIFISGALLSYYWLFLRNRPFHAFNRFFLLSIPFLSLLIPAFHFAPPVFWNPAAGDSPIRLLGVARGSLEEAVTIYASTKKGIAISWESVAGWISVGISICLAVGFIRSIFYLRSLRKQNPGLPLSGATLYFVSEKGTPFSFFKSIFWGREMELTSTESQQILRHELFHVQQQHSLDILVMEIYSICMWFNPFLHIIRFELKAIHEYAADVYAMENTDEYAYAKLLLLNIPRGPVSLVHPFFKNQIKRRITMITKNNKNRKTLVGRFMILPLVTIFICLFSFKQQTNLTHLAPTTLRVVIDPGHGGVFNGTTFNGNYEKNITLSIAKKIQALSKDYHVDVIMTRENDEDLAGNNLDASLKYRVDLASVKNADLFVSIHVNATREAGPQDQHSGFEIYVPDNSNKFHAGSVKLASTITDFIKPDYTIASELKEYAHKVRVLDQATVPAILIECGYITNTSDLSWIQDAKNQEKIARDILEGIQKYGQYATTYNTVPHANQAANENITVAANAVTQQNQEVSQSEQVKQQQQAKDAQELNQSEQVKEMQRTKDAQEVNQSHPAHAVDSSSPVRKVEVEAQYPGGNNAWVQYLIKKSVYPADAEKKEMQGDVQVEFVVNTNGKISEVRAISGPEVFRAESVRLIKESGKWIPAMDKGKKVASYKIQPINYRLQEH
ncbi:MAG TPA: N-acetylmuramoyl-L-alanine amidase [Puia sp.]